MFALVAKQTEMFNKGFAMMSVAVRGPIIFEKATIYFPFP